MKPKLKISYDQARKPSSANAAKDDQQSIPIILIMLYVHNLSGAASKIHAINQKLATTIFDVFALQETWFNSKTDTAALTANTEFILLRADRSNSANTKKKMGGGIAILYRRNIDVSTIGFPPTKLEVQAVRISDAEAGICLINAYVPPYRSGERLSMFQELESVIQIVSENHPDDCVLLVGDFNMPTIEWNYDDDAPGFLSVKSHTYSRHVDFFIEVVDRNCLYQLNDIANENGNILNLILATKYDEINVTKVDESELIDKNSASHNALSVRLNIATSLDFDTTNLSRSIDLRKSTKILKQLSPPISMFFHSTKPGIYEPLMDCFFDSIKVIEEQHTFFYEREINSSQSQHPWTRNKRYIEMYKKKRMLKNLVSTRPSADDIAKLKEISLKLNELYEDLKSEHYASIIAAGPNCPVDLYKLV